MSGPPFTMSKYASELDLLRDKCAWLERELTQERDRAIADVTKERGIAMHWQEKCHKAWDDTEREIMKRDTAERAETAASEYAEEVMAPARELLYLYDWRFDLAKEEKAERAMSPFNSPELNRKLREYGERKKAGWIALRAALAKNPAPARVDSPMEATMPPAESAQVGAGPACVYREGCRVGMNCELAGHCCAREVEARFLHPGRMIIAGEVEPMSSEEFEAEVHAPGCACIRCERKKNSSFHVSPKEK